MHRFALFAIFVLGACNAPSPTAQPPAPPPTAEANATSPNWDAHLLELMPYIDACIERSPQTRWVSYAGGTGEALITVRLSGETGSVDCTIPNDDPNPEYAIIAPRRDELVMESENAAIFVRGPGENPGGECYEAPEVRAADGTLLGWMIDPLGC